MFTLRSAAPPTDSRFAADVQFYLMQNPRQLPSRYLYDALGSALFDAICRLPWYPLARAEARLIEAHGEEIFSRLDSVTTIVELGPGSGEKLVWLLSAAGVQRSHVDVHLVDISRDALALASRAVGALPDVDVVTHEATYEAGLSQLRDAPKRSGRTLLLFLGSNIGNFDPPGCEAFLRAIRASLAPDDALLIGADLVKPERDLLLAYDDPLGVTAAFNRNLLVRLNQELGGAIDVDAFAHRAVWNASASRVEMHLVSQGSQRVQIPGAGVDFEMSDGESIWTESSYKYEPDGIVETLARGGFAVTNQWIDADGRFALTLAACEC